MRFERTTSLKGDYERLSDRDKRLFGGAVRDFNAACDRYVADPGGFQWPAALRVRDVQGAQGVWEMTWSFSGPDGRATFEWVRLDVVDRTGHTTTVAAVRWRRVGDHRILKNP